MFDGTFEKYTGSEYTIELKKVPYAEIGASYNNIHFGLLLLWDCFLVLFRVCVYSKH